MVASRARARVLSGAIEVQPSQSDSLLRLRVDLASARILVWVASLGRDVELNEEAHLYFFNRYQRLSDGYRRRGNQRKAQLMQVKADEHARRGGWDGPPYAAAMGMPRPNTWLRTDAVGRRSGVGPKDAA